MSATSNPGPPLHPASRILLGPGPSMVHPRVYEALSKPLVGHLDPQFLAIMDETQAMLRRVFRTENQLTMSISGTGSAGMEAALANVIEPGDEALICVNGVFGTRMSDMVERLGGTLRRIDRPWGEVFTVDEIAAALDRHPQVRCVAIVHAETSTGARQPLEAIGTLCRDTDRLFLVDAVTSLGGIEVRVDDWNIDVCYSGTQKCLSCPPGLAPITFGPRALDKLQRRSSKVRSWYLDLSMIASYWASRTRTYHHTAPISMNYALHQALAVVLEEGLDARFARHRLHSRALLAGMQAIGFEPFAQESARLPTLNSFRLPDGIEDGPIRRALLTDYGIEIGGGLGALAGKIWRVGLMGESSRRRNVLLFLSALEEILHRAGHLPRAGRAVEAAGAVWSETAPGVVTLT